MITEQDEHVRNILDRKAKIEDLKHLTNEKIKKFSYTKNLSVGSKPKPAPATKQTTKYEKTVQRTTYKHY
jgi:hypothetical protein